MINSVKTAIDIRESDFYGNNGDENGIVINAEEGEIKIEYSDFSDNQSERGCTCIEANNVTSLVLNNVKGDDNAATFDSGFGCVSDSHIEIIDSYFKSTF